MADPNEKWEDNVGGEAVIAGKRVSFYRHGMHPLLGLLRCCSQQLPHERRRRSRHLLQAFENEEELSSAMKPWKTAQWKPWG